MMGHSTLARVVGKHPAGGTTGEYFFELEGSSQTIEAARDACTTSS